MCKDFFVSWEQVAVSKWWQLCGSFSQLRVLSEVNLFTELSVSSSIDLMMFKRF